MTVPKRYLTTPEAAEYLGLTRYGLLERARRGEIPHIPLGPRTFRWDMQDLDLWMRRQRVGAS